MTPILLIAVVGLFGLGFLIAALCFKHPAAKILGGLAIGAGLCALAVGILYAGCILIMRNA